MQSGDLVVHMIQEIITATQRIQDFIIMRAPGILHMAGKSWTSLHLNHKYNYNYNSIADSSSTGTLGL